MERLSKELPFHYTYHCAKHTESVINSVMQLATEEQLDGVSVELVKTAALFHDAGFLECYNDHEKGSCTIAREILPEYDYTPGQIDKICALIMVTKLPQSPSDLMGRILCDADLHYLGTAEYEIVSEDLYNEFRVMRIVKSRKYWDKMQVQFFQKHQYFTKTAIRLYGAKKLENFKLLAGRKDMLPGKYLWVNTVRDIFFMVVGVMLAGFALKGFLLPNNFFDGGVTGLSLLIHEIYHINLPTLIILLNIPLIIAGYLSISPTFAIRTFLCVVFFGACLIWIPYPVITSDKTLISTFGGFFLGIGIGLTMRAGCALDGIEVLALYTWKRTSFTISEIILVLNIVIFGIAAFKFGIETALYSILTYFTASKTIDFVIEGIEEYTGITIISGKSEIIKHRLVNELGRGITIYKGERGFLPGNFEVSSEVDIIFTVVSRLELRKLKNLCYEVDENAFLFANTIKEASGGIIKRRHVH